ncbi:MAG: hypothetical protein AAF489_08705 [Bacteroidota bacterium]
MKNFNSNAVQYLFLVSCLVLCVSCKDTSLEEGQKLRDKASNYLELNQNDSVLHYANEALILFEDNNDSLGIAESLSLAARASALSGDFDDALKFGERGSLLSKQIENFGLEYKLNSTLSWAYFVLKKDFFEILDHLERQLFVVDQLDDDQAKASVYNNYGYDTTVSGTVPLDSVITYMTFANNYYAKSENNNGRWYTLMNLTWQYRLKNDFAQSEHNGRLSVAQAKQDEDRHAIIEANTNLGETLLYQNKMQEATSYYQEALKWADRKEDRDRYVFDVYYSRFLWNIGEHTLAIEAVKGAIQFLETDEVFYEMLGRAFLTQYCFETGDFEEVRKQLAIFKNPRSNYFSFESKVLAAISEAKILAKNNQKEEALLLLSALRDRSEILGAKLLLNEIAKAYQELSD